MKKTSISLITILAALGISLSVVGCNSNKKSSGPKEETFKVTFFNGYPGGGYFTQSVKSGEKVDEPEAPSREGYTFGGWTTDYEGNDQYNFDDEITENIQIYGQWFKDTNTVIFKYNNGQEDGSATIENGGKAVEPNEPTREGYTFTGWYLDALCTEPYDFSKIVDDDLILYCGWQRSAISVTFNLNYTGSNAPITVNAPFNKEVEVPSSLVLDRYLYAFEGWYTKAFPSDSDQPVDLTAGFDDDITLYAKWTRAYYEVTFKAGVNGIDDSVITVPVSSPIATPPSFVREGYTLDSSWYGDSELTVQVDLNNIKDDVIVYAKWNINHYEVKFDLNYAGSSGEPSSQDITYQGLITRPENPEREGYTFLGWFTGAGDEAPEFNVASDTITGNITLYAHWAEKASGKVKITFQYTKGGTVISHSVKEIDNGTSLGSAAMPNDPSFTVTHTSDDYMFIGWYNDANFTNAYDPNRIITADVTIYGRILKRNIFEAEYADLTDLHGVGSSVELNEGAMLFTYEKIGAGKNTGEDWVSNGWYVAGLYYSGAYIDYEIYAAQEINDAVFVMRVSSEFKELHHNPLTPETFGVIVNDVDFEYELPLTLPNPNTDRENDPDGEKTPFKDVIISYHFHLNQGYNRITFETRNEWDYGAGTFKANAPMIDCFYIFTEENAVLNMTECHDFIDEKEAGGN